MVELWVMSLAYPGSLKEKDNVITTAFKMRILSWNIRGAGRKKFLAQLKHLVSCYMPDVLVLMETKVASSKASNIISKINFLNSIEIVLEGYSARIWLF